MHMTCCHSSRKGRFPPSIATSRPSTVGWNDSGNGWKWDYRSLTNFNIGLEWLFSTWKRQSFTFLVGKGFAVKLLWIVRWIFLSSDIRIHLACFPTFFCRRTTSYRLLVTSWVPGSEIWRRKLFTPFIPGSAGGGHVPDTSRYHTHLAFFSRRRRLTSPRAVSQRVKTRAASQSLQRNPQAVWVEHGYGNLCVSQLQVATSCCASGPGPTLDLRFWPWSNSSFTWKAPNQGRSWPWKGWKMKDPLGVTPLVVVLCWFI